MITSFTLFVIWVGTWLIRPSADSGNWVTLRII
jgi:hypothetical protein